MATSLCLFGFLAIFSVISLSSSCGTSVSPICVADPKSPVYGSGFACKDITQVEVTDFSFSGLNQSGTWNKFGSAILPVTVQQVPGLNNIGVSMVRADFGPGGIFPPHVNFVSEIMTVSEGSIEVGFVTQYPDNRLFSKVLEKGDGFVIPQGVIHYQRNVGNGNATALFAFDGQDISVAIVARSVFGSNPKIPSDVLEKAFQVDETIIAQLQSKY